MSRLDPSTHYDELGESLGEPIATAVELCALPHWFDDDLAYEMLSRFGKLNGDAHSTLADLKRLPFIYPYEGGTWHLAPSARAHFTARLARRHHTYLELSRFLKDYLERIRAQVSAPNSPEARELEWRIAYHSAPIDSEATVLLLHRLNDEAVHWSRLADMRAVVDLANEQAPWLSRHAVDLLYFEGHYAYAQGHLKLAETCFTKVWEMAEPSKMKAIAGHLLGVIWMRRRQARSCVLKARDILRESLELGQQLGQTHHQAMVLNSLGGVLVKLGGEDQLEEARRAFERSLELGQQLGQTRHQAMVLNSLGSLLVKLGGEDQLEEARRAFERSLELGQQLGQTHHQAMVLNSLGSVLVKLGGEAQLEEARRAFERSLELLKQVDDTHGQAMVLVSLSTWTEAAGDILQSCSYMEQAILLYEDLGLTRNVKMSQRRLQRLRQAGVTRFRFRTQ